MFVNHDGAGAVAGLDGLGLPRGVALRPSERKVAETLSANAEWFSRATLAEIAARAEVSEPTVLRFTRSVGFTGFQDFKYHLIKNLATPAVPVHSAIDEADSLETVAAKIFGSSITALADVRESLDRAVLGQAVDLLAQASDVIVLGFGASGVVGQDLAQKFPLFGIPINAPTDAHQQFMAAALARPTTVVVAISNTAATVEVLNSAAEARKRGAGVIAICGTEGPLTRLADVVLLAGSGEDTDAFTPTTSRLAQLVVVDVLAVAVALRAGRLERQDLRRMKRRLTQMRTSGQVLIDDPDDDASGDGQRNGRGGRRR